MIKLIIDERTYTKRRTTEEYQKVIEEQGKTLYKLNKKMQELNKVNRQQIVEIRSLKYKWNVLKKKMKLNESLGTKEILKEMEGLEQNECIK